MKNNSITAEDMSKEQTPIEQEMLIHFNGKRGIYLNKAQIREVSEFLNAKVLEALERVREKLTEKTYTDSFVSLNAFEVIDEEIKKQK